MSASPTATLRYRSSIVSLHDVDCRADRGGPGPEELAAKPEIVFVRKGLFVRHLERNGVTADASRVLFFNAGECHRVSHPSGGGDACTTLRFSDDLLASVLGRRDGRAGRRWFPLPALAVSRGLVVDLHRLRAAAAGSEVGCLDCDGLALSLLERLLDELASALAPGDAPRALIRSAFPVRSTARRAMLERVEACRSILASRLGEPLALHDLAREVGVSPFHLHRTFRAVTGHPIHRYRNELRLREALDRLAGGERDLTRLALDLGFSGHAHFATAFRRHFGAPPSVERRRLNRASSRKPDRGPVS